MRLIKYDSAFYDKYIKFNENVYPDRGDIKQSFQKRLLDNPLLKDKNNPYIILALDDNDEIIGQFIISPVELMYKNEIKQCFFGSDFIVDEKYRNTGAGALLALRAIRSFKPYFAIGVSEHAHKIHLSCNTNIAGCAYKYLYLRKRVSTGLKTIKGIIKHDAQNNNSSSIEFPSEVKTNEYYFQRSSNVNDFQTRDYDGDVIKFVHSKSFLRWRFFSNTDRYAMYVLDKAKQNYFIVRKCSWRGLNLLFIVDYFFSQRNEMALKHIIKASQDISKMCNLDGVITTSSLHIVDGYLKKESFHVIKNPIWIFASSYMVPVKDLIDARNAVFITPADSDYEFNFDNIV